MIETDLRLRDGQSYIMDGVGTVEASRRSSRPLDGRPGGFCRAERSRAALRQTRTPITRSHSEMTVGPMMVNTRETVVGSPVKA